MFVAALSHDGSGDGNNAGDKRLIEAETDKAGPTAIWRARPVHDSEAPINNRHVLVSGFTACC